MNDILHIISYLFYIIMFSTLVFSMNYYMKVRLFKKSKHDINILQAKIVNLRMALKARVKIKIKSFRARFVNPINKGDAIDVSLKTLSENKFETAQDFQDYIDLSRKINGLINSELQASVAFQKEKENGQEFEDFMGPDYRNEIAIIRILKEITDANDKLMQKIEHYNSTMEAKIPRIPPVTSLQFPSLMEVNRVFRDSNDLIKQSKDDDPDLFEIAS